MQALLGRERELSELGALLEERRPARIVLRGPLGVGKTSLLRVACEGFPEWSLVPGAGQSGVYVEPRDTPETLSDKLSSRLLEGDDEDGDIQEVITTLAKRAPAMFVIERYRPSPRVDRWFEREVAKPLSSQDSAIVLVLTDPPKKDSVLVSHADLDLTLGPLPADAVRRQLELSTLAVVPPIDEAELEVYVEEICSEPGLLAPLERVLTAAPALPAEDSL